ncbi:MAG: cytochrome c-type biogenesis protein [bacterium]
MTNLLIPLVRLFFVAMVFLSVTPVYSAEDIHQFPTDELRQRYIQLNTELRCPKCQNQNLADSNSMIAEDLRAEVKRLLLEGKSDKQIKQFLVDRYGDFVLYRPPVKDTTWVLWLAPVALVLVGALVLLILVRRQRHAREDESPPSLSDQDQQKLKRLLDDRGESS